MRAAIVVLALCAGTWLTLNALAASVTTATFIYHDGVTLVQECANPRVVRKAGDVLIRCAGRPDELWLRVTNAAVNCPAPKASQDPVGNLTLRC